MLSHFLNSGHISLQVATKHTDFSILIILPDSRVQTMAPKIQSFTMTSPTLALLLLLLGLSTIFTETQAAACGSPPNLATCYSATVADVTPSAACCQGLRTYISTSGPACLCQAATDPQFTKSGAKPEYSIKLPQKCKLVFKAGSVCNGQVIPGGQ